MKTNGKQNLLLAIYINEQKVVFFKTALLQSTCQQQEAVALRCSVKICKIHWKKHMLESLF